MLFRKQIELLALLNADWAQAVSEKQRKTLAKFPFQDTR
jgi:hypothetical protein